LDEYRYTTALLMQEVCSMRLSNLIGMNRLRTIDSSWICPIQTILRPCWDDLRQSLRRMICRPIQTLRRGKCEALNRQNRKVNRNEAPNRQNQTAHRNEASIRQILRHRIVLR
jgi:hypothetical protein